MGPNWKSAPWGLTWRSHTAFICITVGVGSFTDFFLYGLIVPVLPFMLQDRIHVSGDEVQSIISQLLAIYAAASCLVSPFAGVLADRTSSSRQLPFLLGLVLLLFSTILLAIGQSIFVLAVARLMQGASAGVIWTIGIAILIETVGADNLGKSIGTIFSFCSIGTLFSPAVGGLLYAKSGYTGVFGLGLALIAIDFALRLLMIEKKVAAKYIVTDSDIPSSTGNNAHADETTPLVGSQSATSQKYKLPEPTRKITKEFPILLVLRDRGLLTAFFIGFIQAILLGAFDATVPLIANELYGFDSFKAGLLFLPLGGTDLLLGPLFGWAVDRFGSKPMAVLGLGFLVPTLILLRLPGGVARQLPVGNQVALYAILLALNGVGLAIFNSTNVVEAGSVLEKYYRANQDLFDHQAPYAQLYGINSLIWSFGLTVGPLIGGSLRYQIGYGNMNAVLAGICAFTAILSLLFVQGKNAEQDTNDSAS